MIRVGLVLIVLASLSACGVAKTAVKAPVKAAKVVVKTAL